METRRSHRGSQAGTNLRRVASQFGRTNVSRYRCPFRDSKAMVNSFVFFLLGGDLSSDEVLLIMIGAS